MKNFSQLNALEAITLYKSLDLETEAKEIIEHNKAADLETVAWPWNRKPKAWEHSSYAFGFIPINTSNDNLLKIHEARSITADQSLKDAKINISLDYFRAYEYPGRGKHRVLFKFNAKNYLKDSAEQDLSFNQTFAIQEGQNAPISGYPIFIGLNTGKQLMQFDVEIINVSYDNDDQLLDAMEKGVVKNGITLLGTLNPVIPILSEYATGITKLIAGRNRNREITSPKMGLYFDNIASHLKMARGVYIALQTSEPGVFDWNQWHYNRSFGTVQSIDGTYNELPYNYFAFSIS